jgi:hypothetical protein
MNTKAWGPSGWTFMFSCIMGRFPETTLDEHAQIVEDFITLFSSMERILPCVYCRDSFKVFYNELDITEYTDSRDNMMRWLYLIKDKVNKKLLKQEQMEFAKEKYALVNSLLSGIITQQEYTDSLVRLKKEIFCTVESPPFEDVLAYYKGFKASCSVRVKRCL